MQEPSLLRSKLNWSKGLAAKIKIVGPSFRLHGSGRTVLLSPIDLAVTRLSPQMCPIPGILHPGFSASPAPGPGIVPFCPSSRRRLFPPAWGFVNLPLPYRVRSTLLSYLTDLCTSRIARNTSSFLPRIFSSPSSSSSLSIACVLPPRNSWLFSRRLL